MFSGGRGRETFDGGSSRESGGDLCDSLQDEVGAVSVSDILTELNLNNNPCLRKI